MADESDRGGRVSGGPRAEARPLQWHEMTEDQRKATREILDLVDAMAREPGKEDDAADVGRGMEQVSGETFNAIKTLVGLIDKLCKLDAAHMSERLNKVSYTGDLNDLISETKARAGIEELLLRSALEQIWPTDPLRLALLRVEIARMLATMVKNDAEKRATKIITEANVGLHDLPRLRRQVRHRRVQHAVGQGGFHSAILQSGSATFSYVYDCGAKKAADCSPAIEDLKDTVDSVDMLFLSHLDTDHTNGVDRLMTSLKVGTVVLPYLSPFEQLVTAVGAATASRGRTGKEAVALVADPVGWLTRHGASRVIFVRRRENEDGPVVVPSLPVDVREWRLDAPLAATPRVDARAGDSMEIMPSGPIAVGYGGSPVWMLMPFVHPEPIEGAEFRTNVAKKFGFATTPTEGDPVWSELLRNIVARRKSRQELAELYGGLNKDRNRTSMSLYSGPPKAVHGNEKRATRFEYDATPSRRGHVRKSAAVGWLGTGDTHLDVNMCREAFEGFFEEVLPNVTTLMLPHHGSRLNLETEFIKRYPKRTWVAAYGTDNNFRHPGRRIVAAARRHGEIVRVTERPHTRFVESVVLSW